jgi:hypothetical protein
MTQLHHGWEPLITVLIDRVTPRPGDRSVLVRLIYSPAPAYREDPVFLTRFEERLARLYEEPPRDAVEAQVAEGLKSGFDPQQRWHARLPDAYTHGIPVFVLEAMLFQSDFPPGFQLPDIDHCQLPAQRNPRDGVVEMLPYTPEELVRRHQQRVHVVARRGVEVRAVLVQANRLLYQGGVHDNLPALVLVALDPQVANDDAYMLDLTHRLFELKQANPRTPAEQHAQSIILANENRAVYHRRAQLPTDFTHGHAVYACDLWVHRPYLTHGYLVREERFLPCVFDTHPDGGIELLPPLVAEVL